MGASQTLYYKPKKSKTASLLIIDMVHAPTVIRLQGSCTVGRECEGSDRDLRLRSEIISRVHGEFIYDDSDGSYYYIDNNSYNGTYINNVKLTKFNERGSMAYKLSDGDIIRVDGPDLKKPHPAAMLLIFSTVYNGSEVWQESRLDASRPLSVGRGDNCDIRVHDLMASKCHAILTPSPEGWTIEDNNSTNGIGLNGCEITQPKPLYPLDVIRIADTTLVFLNGRVVYNSSAEKLAVLGVDIREKTVQNGRKTLLRDVRAELRSGDFALILGGSGAGKTTLIRAILGESRANGKIVLNGQDLYQNFKNLKSQIGMVPQFLTLRTNDTVRDTLYDTAAIKLGRTYSKRERQARVEEVLEHVGILEHADKLIGQLSGGQQKKVSVANQLVGFQKVFICDENDSDLDAASRMQQMEILREIADEGKIVMVISHEPDDAVTIVDGVRVSLFTKVLVLAKSSADGAGHLAFFGGVDEAKDFFGVTRLQDIMLQINPATEGGLGRGDEFIQKYIRMKGELKNG